MMLTPITINIGLLILRIVVGFLFVGHGLQKLLGWFGGSGLSGHANHLETLGIRPPLFWAVVSALGEFLGGLGFALGLLTPVAAAVLIGNMLVAIVKVHWANGLWNANRGIEWPLVLLAVAFVVGLTGPGYYALDRVLHLTLPEPLTYVVVLLAMLLVTVGELLVSPARRGHEHQAA
jgi:putative oxidoreductase